MPQGAPPLCLPLLLSPTRFPEALGTVNKSYGILTLQKPELPGEGAVGTSCEWDEGAGCVGCSGHMACLLQGQSLGWGWSPPEGGGAV